MSFHLSKKRSSITSNNFLSTLHRRLSITTNELEQIQNALQKRKRLTKSIIFIILTGSPFFILLYQTLLLNKSFKEFIANNLNLHNMKTQFLATILNNVSWLIVLLIIQFQLLFYWYLPATEQEMFTVLGQKFKTKHNGFVSNILINLLYLLGTSSGFYDGNIIFVNWIKILVVLSIFSILLQTYLFTFYNSLNSYENFNFLNFDQKNFIDEIFFGRHLQPIVFGIDVKMFITNRIMFSLWSLYIISAIYHQIYLYNKLSISLLTCSILQFIYILRRQWFEYVTQNLDYKIDKMGFYRIWGVLVFLPTIYLTPITLLAQTEKNASFLLCTTFFFMGLFVQYLNSDIDLQKYKFRKAKGQWKIGNKDPFYITAKFRKDNGEMSSQLLLGSGYWGKARHLNYTVEVLTFLTWSLKFDSIINYFPVAFLTALLYIRMQEDEIRCLLKYTYHWLHYVTKVPYFIIPGII